MRALLLVLVLIGTSTLSHAAERRVIPDKLNQFLTHVKKDMTKENLNKALKKYYPNAEFKEHTWNKKTGYINADISPKLSISVAAYGTKEKPKVHESLKVYVYNKPTGQRLEMILFNWDPQS